MRRSMKPLPLTAIVLVATLGLSACTADDGKEIERFADRGFAFAKWQQQKPMYESVVEPITMNHPVLFVENKAELSADALLKIGEFLGSAEVAQGDRIEVDGPRNASGNHDPITAARLAVVRGELKKAGFDTYVPDAAVTPLQPRKGSVEILVTRVVVIEPECVGPQPEPGYRPEQRWSCTTTANLGRMVADPADLARGRALSPADAEGSSLSIQRYRTDQVKDLNKGDLRTSSQ